MGMYIYVAGIHITLYDTITYTMLFVKINICNAYHILIILNLPGGPAFPKYS